MCENIHLILAVTDNGVIGNNGDIPWNIKEDMQHFKRVTSGHTVVMGRKTYESLPHGALPFRKNIVLTTNEDWFADDVTVMHDPKEVLLFASAHPEETIFIMGGAEIYKAFEDYAVTCYLTRIHAEVEGDTTFELDKKSWTPLTLDVGGKCYEAGIDYDFSILTKIKE